MPDGESKWLFQEIYRLLLLAKIGAIHKGKEKIDKAIEYIKEIEKLWKKK